MGNPIEMLVEALFGPPERRPEARTALRNTIDRITAEPRTEGRGLDLLVHGRLAQILQIAQGRPDLIDRGGPANAAASLALLPTITKLVVGCAARSLTEQAQHGLFNMQLLEALAPQPGWLP